ncbi:MAG: PD-(D/E)XK nuclease family protein [Candidatus Heimdallarchaeota archaeon]
MSNCQHCVKAEEKFDIDYLDPSSFCSFNRCPAKFLLGRLMALEPINSNGLKQLAMDYGTDMHEALPHCYDTEEGLHKGIDLFKERWEARGHEFNDKRNISCATTSMCEFFGKHSGVFSPYSIIDVGISAPTEFPVAKNELPFLIDIGGLLPLAGRIDFPCMWNSDKTIWAGDYKTSGEISVRLKQNFENAPAAIAYTLGLSTILNVRVMGMLLELIRVSKTNAESDIHMVFVRDKQIHEFIEQANRTSEKIQMCNVKQAWPKNFAMCSTYPSFGQPGYSCEFLDFCTTGDMSMYRKGVRYHPFEIEVLNDAEYILPDPESLV